MKPVDLALKRRKISFSPGGTLSAKAAQSTRLFATLLPAIPHFFFLQYPSCPVVLSLELDFRGNGSTVISLVLVIMASAKTFEIHFTPIPYDF